MRKIMNVDLFKRFLKENKNKLSDLTVKIEEIPSDDPWILDDGWDDIYERMDEYGEEGSN